MAADRDARRAHSPRTRTHAHDRGHRRRSAGAGKTDRPPWSWEGARHGRRSYGATATLPPSKDVTGATLRSLRRCRNIFRRVHLFILFFLPPPDVPNTNDSLHTPPSHHPEGAPPHRPSYTYARSCARARGACTHTYARTHHRAPDNTWETTNARASVFIGKISGGRKKKFFLRNNNPRPVFVHCARRSG